MQSTQESRNALQLETRGLVYAYQRGKNALDGVDFGVSQGEKVAIMGANGSGKSTFFLNINGVLTPEQGEVLLNGRKIKKKNLNELRRKVGIVFQDADNQIIASTVLGEVSFGPMNLKLPREEVVRRVEQALSYMDITGLKDRPPHYLSGGEKKRVSIADIIAMEPEIIIFDEPAAALDPASGEMLLEVLEKLSAEGKTLLLSTHDVDFAYAWAERVVVFSEGRILADDIPEAIFEDEGILQKAHLRKPVIWEVAAMMKKKGWLSPEEKPRDVRELLQMVDKGGN